MLLGNYCHNKTTMQRLKLEIDNGTFIRFLTIVTVFGLALLLLWKVLPALMIILVAFVLALALNPSVHALSRYMPGQSRILATLIVYVVVLGIIGLFLYIVLPPMIEQTSNFVATLPGYLANLSEQQGIVADVINKYQLQDEMAQAAQNIQGQVFNIASGIGVSLLTGVTSLLGGLTVAFTVFILSILMLIEAPEWGRRIWKLYTNQQKRQRHERLMNMMYRVVGSFVNGQVLVAFIAGLASLVVLVILSAIFGLPTGVVLPLAGVVFITSLIPMIGATIGAVVVTFVLLLNDIGAAISFIVYFIIYQQIENNFIQPVVQSRTVALSALGVFVSVIIGFALLGPLGGIIAIPIAGCARVLLLDFMEHRKKSLAKLEEEFVK